MRCRDGSNTKCGMECIRKSPDLGLGRAHWAAAGLRENVDGPVYGFGAGPIPRVGKYNFVKKWGFSLSGSVFIIIDTP